MCASVIFSLCHLSNCTLKNALNTCTTIFSMHCLPRNAHSFDVPMMAGCPSYSPADCPPPAICAADSAVTSASGFSGADIQELSYASAPPATGLDVPVLGCWSLFLWLWGNRWSKELGLSWEGYALSFHSGHGEGEHDVRREWCEEGVMWGREWCEGDAGE